MIKSLYPCFQHWGKNGAVYLISDTHFKDLDRKHMGYFISNEDQIYILKDTCHKNDTLIHLGDVGDPEYMLDLKCHRVLIMGNHDKSIEKMEHYFEEVYSGPLWISQKLVLSHEPVQLTTWDTYESIAFNIHGHDHAGTKRDFHLNICPNIYGYVPLNLKQFINSGKLKEINDIHRVTINNATAKLKGFDILKEWYTDTGIENT